MPRGWQQIALPTWRGFTPGASYYDEVPPDEFRPEHQIRPELVAWGLMTCYGKPGVEPATAPDGGPALEDTHGWDSRYPWGVPAWIVGQSVSVWDTMLDSTSYCTGARRSRVPRGTEAEEAIVTDLLTATGRKLAAKALRDWAASRRTDRKRTTTEERTAFLAAADDLDAGRSAIEVWREVRALAMRAGANHSTMYILPTVAEAESMPTPWAKARKFGLIAAEIVRELRGC